MIAMLLGSIAFGQRGPSPIGANEKIAIGTVTSVAGNRVYVNLGQELIALTADEHTEIWNGKVFPTVSVIEAGDEIMARCRRDSGGRWIAETMRINGFNAWGVIKRVTENGFEVLTYPNADPQSAYKKENKLIEIDADTSFTDSAREDLKQGRNVDVAGVNLRNGTVRATQVTVREGYSPVRMPKNSKIIMPNGEVRTLDRIRQRVN